MKNKQAFWDNVDRRFDCWNWTGSINKGGYGVYTFKGKTIGAHRVSWIWSNYEIPSFLEVCHKCDNTKCVNPDHLWIGTHKKNMADKTIKGRNPFQKRRKYKYPMWWKWNTFVSDKEFNIP